MTINTYVYIFNKKDNYLNPFMKSLFQNMI